MQYIDHKTNSTYLGDKAHWRDIETTSEQPSPHHKPIVTDSVHTGWRLDVEAYKAEAEANRKAAYIAEADPLFFKYHRGEATEQEWLDKIAEIKARYPKE